MSLKKIQSKYRQREEAYEVITDNLIENKIITFGPVYESGLISSDYMRGFLHADRCQDVYIKTKFGTERRVIKNRSDLNSIVKQILYENENTNFLDLPKTAREIAEKYLEYGWKNK